MLATVGFVIHTHTLASSVGVAALLKGLLFAAKIAQIFALTPRLSPDGRKRAYTVAGQVFYGSVQPFQKGFDFKEVVDVSQAHIWDISSIAAVDKAGAAVEIVGLNEASETITDKLRGTTKPESATF